VLDDRQYQNLVVTSGKRIIVKRLTTTNTDGQPYLIEWGTGTNAPTMGDTGLQTLVGGPDIVDNAVLTTTNFTNDTLVITKIYDPGGGDLTYNEFGCFEYDPLGTPNELFARVVVSPAIVKLSAQTLTLNWSFILSSA
jgi:hypothetical protein